jgi:hypothetical protein
MNQRFCARSETHFLSWLTVRAIATNSYRFLAERAQLPDQGSRRLYWAAS